MTRLLPALAAIPLVLAYGAAEGVWTHRWLPDRAADEAAARLARVPLAVGDWQAEEQRLDERQVQKAEVTGHLLRHYTHKGTGAALSVLMVCGRPGPVSVHTPDVCYGGAGYALTAPATRHTVRASPPAAFWVGNFRKVGAPFPEHLRIFWAWSAGGDWTAPDNPRIAFGRAAALYKLYVVRPITDVNEAPEKDVGADFLRQFLPAADAALSQPAVIGH